MPQSIPPIEESSREPYYHVSTAILSRIARGEIQGAAPAHALTTMYYLVERYADRDTARRAIDWILGDFEIPGEDRDVMLRARSLALEDFEDAVVAAAAEAHCCEWIVTRNIRDFRGSLIPGITPAELLEMLIAG